MTKEDLLLLSNLMHIKKEAEKSTVFGDIWVESNLNEDETIGDIVDAINQKLDDLSMAEKEKFLNATFDGEISGSEWEQMLNSVANNEALCNLKVSAVDMDDKKALTVCLTDENNNAYVVFRGTGAGEWPDNFEGGYKADTEQQRRALEFVEGLPSTYQNITVIGHSKGGNKAKYVAILSDRVKSCISFDGEGFSQEFWEKYSYEIEKNKGKKATRI